MWRHRPSNQEYALEIYRDQAIPVLIACILYRYTGGVDPRTIEYMIYLPKLLQCVRDEFLNFLFRGDVDVIDVVFRSRG